MAVVLPLVAAVLLWVLHWRRDRRAREAVADAAIVWGLLTVMCAEGLSLGNWYTRGGVAAFWAAVLVGIGGAWWLTRGQASPVVRDESERLTKGQWVLVGWVGVIAALLLVVAVMAPPNTWDAMTYHMPRVAAWIQNQSVDHFPTHASRQLEFPPFAEYVIAQFQVLLGSDQLANLGQWGAMAGSVVVSSLVAKRLGAGVWGQVLAAVVCATIPPGILEATGAKNDYVTAFWTLCAVLKLIDVSRATDAPGLWREALRFGGAIGLAMLTKGTVYILGWPLLAVLGVVILWRHRWRAVAPLAVASCLAVSINVPHFARNHRVIGDLFGSKQSRHLMETKVHAPWVVASNVARNLAMQVATPSERVNEALLQRPVEALHRWAGVDPSDPRTTIDPRFTPFKVRWGELHDDNSGGLLHVPLILAGLAGMLWGARRAAGRGLVLALALALVVSFLTFCHMITWQPWHGRYFIVPYVLWAPLLGAWLGRGPRPVGYAVAGVLLAAAMPYVVRNQMRPLVGARNVFTTPRVEQYFVSQPHLLATYRKAADVVARRGVKQVGLLTGEDSWVYPFRVALAERLGRQVRVDYLNGFDWPGYNKVRIPGNERPAGPVVAVLPGWDWGYHKPAPLVLTEETGRKFYLEQDFGGVVLFTRQPRSFDDKVFFGRGWVGVERPAWGWANWMSGQAATLVLSRSKAGEVVLDGTMISTTVPNVVRFKVNGREAAAVNVDWQHDRPFGPVRLPLRAGDNVVEVTCDRPAARLDGDSRSLSVLLGNLTLKAGADRAVTKLEPQNGRPGR